MVHYKLTYFNIKGLAEPIRYILSYMGKEFEDVRYEFEDWPQRKKSTPYGKIPTLEIDGTVYTDSTAICRYLAKEAGLSGKTDIENLCIDQMGGAVSDLFLEMRKWFGCSDPAAKEEIKVKIVDEIIPLYMGNFENHLERNGGYLANGRLSWADLYLVAYSETINTLMEIELEEKYKNFKLLKEKVQSEPGIQSWIKRRPTANF